MDEEPVMLRLRGRRPPLGHICPSDVNIRWFLDHLQHREVMRMSEEVMNETRHQLNQPCLGCSQRFDAARLIDTQVSVVEIISGISRYSLS